MYLVNLKCRCINWDISNSSSTFLSTFTLWLIPFPSFTLLILENFLQTSNILQSNQKRPPLIWRYCPYRLSRGSLWNREVNTNLYPSCRRSSISAAWQRSVRRRAELVWAADSADFQLIPFINPVGKCSEKLWFLIILHCSVSQPVVCIFPSFWIGNGPQRWWDWEIQLHHSFPENSAWWLLMSNDQR